MYLDGEDDLLDLEKLDPAFTDYIRQCQYVMYPDLADALKPGRHCLAAIVASGWRDNPGVNRLLNVNDGNVAEFMGQPCLTAMLRLTYQDGREELIVTDETWQCGHGGYQFASVFDGTVYDAREDAPEWNLPDFKGSFRPVKLMDPLAATQDCHGWNTAEEPAPYDAPVPARMEPILIPPIIEFESTAPTRSKITPAAGTIHESAASAGFVLSAFFLPRWETKKTRAVGISRASATANEVE